MALVGQVIEGALQQLEQVGGEYRPKYQLEQLLDPKFRLEDTRARRSDINLLKRLARAEGTFVTDAR